MAKSRLKEIGWREWVDLIDLGIRRIKAKVDTGARTSALHATVLEVFTRGGTAVVRFTVHPRQRSRRGAATVEANLLGERRVRNSGGSQSLRPVIETMIEIKGERWPIELTLVPRDEMGFRMLLGRQAIRGRFVVNPGRSYLANRVAKPARRSKGQQRADSGSSSA